MSTEFCRHCGLFLSQRSAKRTEPFVREALCTFVSGVYADFILKTCDIIDQRVQELTPEEINKLVAVLANPKPYRTPPEFYENRKDGKTFQLLAESADTKLRKTLERIKKASDAGQLS